MKGLGFADLKDEADARDRLLQAYQQRQSDLDAREKRLQELEPLANAGREYIETLRTPQAKAEEAKPKGWWNPPQVDPALVRKYQTVDAETGNVVWKAETPAHLRADYEKNQGYYEQWTNQLIYNPREALAAPIREQVESYLSEVLGVPVAELPNRLDLSGEKRALNEVLSQNAERIYHKNPVTNQLDSQRLTPFGESLEEALADLQEIKDPQRRYRVAMAMAEQKHPVKPPAPTREENKTKVLQRNGASGLPQRNGSEGIKDRPQNRNLSPGQQLSQRLAGLAS